MSQWSSFSDFIAMSGYGRYVWGAYGMVLLCFIYEIYSVWKRRKIATRDLMIEARAHQAEEDL